jgi:hypothetical protein
MPTLLERESRVINPKASPYEEGPIDQIVTWPAPS